MKLPRANRHCEIRKDPKLITQPFLFPKSSPPSVALPASPTSPRDCSSREAGVLLDPSCPEEAVPTATCLDPDLDLHAFPSIPTAISLF